MSLGPPSTARLRRCHRVGGGGGGSELGGRGAMVGPGAGAGCSMDRTSVSTNPPSRSHWGGGSDKIGADSAAWRTRRASARAYSRQSLIAFATSYRAIPAVSATPFKRIRCSWEGFDVVGDEGHRNHEDLAHSPRGKLRDVIGRGPRQPLHRADLALVAERPLLAGRQPLHHAGDGGVDLALVGIAAPDHADRDAVRAEQHVDLRRIGKTPQTLLYGAGQRIEVLRVLRIAVDFHQRQQPRVGAPEVEERGLGRRRAPHCGYSETPTRRWQPSARACATASRM